MDLPAAEYIRHRLIRFEQSVDDTALHYSKLERSGTGCASAPYREKCAIRALLNSPDYRGPEYELLMQEYFRITQKLESFRNKKGPEYLNHLFCELRNYAHAYHAAVCYLQLGQSDPDILIALSRRDLIGELCRELDSDFELSGIKALVTRMDENLSSSVPADHGLSNGADTPSCDPNRKPRSSARG
jgi:hypothetical protein